MMRSTSFRPRSFVIGSCLAASLALGAHVHSDQAEVWNMKMGGPIELAEAPAGARVLTMGGNIHIGNAGDHVNAKTMGGNIAIDAVDGSITATTMAGDISARMVGDPARRRRDVQLSSNHGSIKLTVPRDLSMEIDITLAYTDNSTREYHIASDFPLQERRTDRWDRWHGTPRKYIYGTGRIAGGKNHIVIETVNGDVELKSEGARASAAVVRREPRARRRG